MSATKSIGVWLSVGFTVLALVGCSQSGQPSDEGGNSEDDIASACGKQNYAAANALYKEAVAQAKSYNAERCSENQAEIAGKMSAAIETCGAFRDVYAASQWAAPVRQALAGNFIDGILRGERFDQAIVGAHFETGRPGAGPAQFELTFETDSSVRWIHNRWDDEAETWVRDESVRGYTLASNPDDEMAGWILTIERDGDAGPAEYRLLRQQTSDDAADRQYPTYLIKMLEDEEVIFSSYADVCSA